MTPPVESACLHFQLGLLRSASLLVPGKQRAEWLREWHAELWHVRRECVSAGSGSLEAEREVTSFCLGALQDAFCLRRHSWHTEPFATLQGSAGQCILWLAAALAVSYAMALLLPGVRAESHPFRYQVNPGLILIQNAHYNNDSVATISVNQYRSWKARSQRYFDGFAFYRIGRETVSTATDAKAGWSVAHASSNLFVLLGLPIRFRPSASEVGSNLPKMILSDGAWKRDFGADPHIAGSVLLVGTRRVMVIGVAPDGAWRLPGKVDAWLLDPDSEIASGSLGFVIAHLTSLGRNDMWTERVHITTYNPDDSTDDLWGVSFDERTQGPWNIYLFTVLLAFLALPAITSVSMGECCFSSHKPSWSARLCRWGFLSMKIALVLAITYYWSLDLAYWRTTGYSLASQYVQLITSFSICLLGMSWVVLDQRRRCPVCLRLVTNPAQVGLASRTFLAWNGTELICAGGHTLLHIPVLPTSWFSTQRWLYLDTSWDFLFAGSGVG